MREILAVVCVALAACSSAGAPRAADGDAGSLDSALSFADAALGDAHAGDAAPGPISAPWPSGHVPRLGALSFRCKLISDRDMDDPTPNQTHSRANLRGTDLGIPVRHGDDLYFFFGDTAGAQGIWPFGSESLPDAVGYADARYDAVIANPESLCTGLRFLLSDTASGSVDADFAGAYMIPPPGAAIGEFVHNPAGPRGENVFPNMPGDFEVPSGAFSHAGSIYLFYTTVQVDPLEMRGSYLARWSAPARSALPSYEILYHVDQRFDDSGPLRGDFINIAALVDGEHVYLYGTGKFRASPVHLARKRLDALDVAGGYERYDAASATWVSADAEAAPIVPEPTLGELSVRYFPEAGRYVMLDQEINLGNRIAARFAEAPAGPWSAPVTVATMEDPAFAARHCCLGSDCPGERMFVCGEAGFYGTYMLPGATANADGSVSISFLVSTWVPYNVALMTATFE